MKEHIIYESLGKSYRIAVTKFIYLKTILDSYFRGWERGGGMDHVSQRKRKPFHDSRVLKKQFHGKLDSNKII